MFEENVVSSAGTTFKMNAESIEQRIRAAGFKGGAAQRALRVADRAVVKERA